MNARLLTAATSAFTMDVVASRVTSPELIGRQSELATLEAAFQGATAGTPAVMLVAGESGVGKSRLVAELSARVANQGALVLTGECVELSEGEIPFAPVVSALRRFAKDDDEGIVDGVFGTWTGTLMGPDSLALGSTGQARLFELLLGVFEQLAAKQPLMVVIEDLHWADRSTRDLLLFIAHSLRDERVLFVITYRSDELHRRHPLRPFLVQLAAIQSVARVELGRLSRDQVCEQLERIVGERTDATLTEAIYARSEGNPLFTEELVAARSTHTADTLPDTLRDALLQRVDDLPPPAQQVVRVAAAAGRRAQHDLLAAVVDLPEADLLEALREAVGGHVLVEAADEQSYEFRHALLREAVYGDLLPGERSKLHIELAEAMAANPGLAGQEATVSAELAYHWYAAHQLGRALRASIDAGFESDRIYAFAEAARHYERALDLWECGSDELRVDRRELLRLAAAATHRSGEAERAIALARVLVAEIDPSDDPEGASAALERLGRYLWTTGHGEEALPIYHRAVEVLPSHPSEALARALAAEGQVLMLSDRPGEGKLLCDTALPMARATGARAVEANILNTLVGCVGGYTNDIRAATAFMDEGLAIAEELDLSEEILRSLFNGADALDQAGRVEDAIERALAGAERARELGFERHTGHLMETEAAHRLIRLDRWDEAARLADRVIATGTNLLALSSAKAVRATVAMDRGDFELAHALLDDASSLIAPQGGSMWLTQASVPLSRLAIHERRPEDARAIVAAALERLDSGEYVFYTAPLYWAGISAEADIAELARPLRDSAAVAECERRALELLERIDGLLARYEAFPPPPQAAAFRTLARAELSRLRGASDPAAWADAATDFDALGGAGEAAYARYRRAEAMVLMRAPRQTIADVLAAARELADRLQMTPLLTEIDGLARRARLKLDNGADTSEAEEPPETAADRLGLTNRELDVLGLVTEGRTNREIGELLYMSEKTASVHVSRILAKLGAANRAEAAASAERLGLVGSR
jgi:DNA-binding CsgD family transcriptional regulator/tetratricopeptide (TPR) repeat protein